MYLFILKTQQRLFPIFIFIAVYLSLFFSSNLYPNTKHFKHQRIDN